MEDSREEIRQKRRENRKLKKEEVKLLKENAARKRIVQKDSQKVQVLDANTFDKFNSPKDFQVKLKNKRRKDLDNKEFSLLDYLAKKEKARRKARGNFLKPVKVNKGKVKTKKHVSTLKKLIKRFRALKVDKSFVGGSEIEEKKNDNVEKLESEEKKSEKVESVRYIHSNTFRSYCDNTTSITLSNQTEALIRKLNEFQRRALEKNAIKAKAHKRFVVGFRELKNHLLIKKLKLVIIATDCEKCDIEGGLDDMIESIKSLCQTDQEVPCCFSLRRRQLSYCLYKKVPVGCVGILSYDGAQDIFHSLLKTLEEEKLNYLKFFR